MATSSAIKPPSRAKAKGNFLEGNQRLRIDAEF
jgi:hypothetical protein